MVAVSNHIPDEKGGTMVTREQVTAEQRWLVQASWDKVAPMAPHVAELFYDRLFELNPLLEDHFPADISEAGAQLMQTIGEAVAGLEDPGSVTPCLHELGRYHLRHGMRPGYYETMGSALLWTLEQSLAEDFTPRVKEAWSVVYQLFSAVMLEAADVVVAKEPASARRGVEAVLTARRAG
jgi:methyl-accepting chemotaxis protein